MDLLLTLSAAVGIYWLGIIIYCALACVANLPREEDRDAELWRNLQ